MKWLNGYRIRLVLVGFVAAIVLGGGSARADFAFGKPVNLGPTINSENSDWLPCISADGLEMYFSSNRAGGYGDQDIYVTTRSTADADWGPPVNLGPTVNGPSEDSCAFISADGLTLYYVPLYFESGGSWAWDIWITRRLSKDADWGKPINLGPTVNSPSIDVTPSISNNGLELYFASNRSGGYGAGDLYVSTRVTTDSDWGTPMNLGPAINNSSADYCPFISSDGLALFFSSDNFGPFRPGGLGRSDIWVTMRTRVFDPWGPPVNLGATVNSSAVDYGPSISADGSTLYFSSDRPGGIGSADLWQAPIIPVVDFNRDEIVNLKDFSRLGQHWAHDESSVDIGPMPWGDGRVDIQDIAALVEHWLTGF
jgi:Tol biopolymer transport system component